MNLLRLLHMPKIEEPLKKIVRQRNFLGSLKKMARRETCERRQRLAVACADKKKDTSNIEVSSRYSQLITRMNQQLLRHKLLYILP